MDITASFPVFIEMLSWALVDSCEMRYYLHVMWSQSQFSSSELPQTDHDFNLEKQQLVHNGKLKVQEEYAQKEKDLEVEQRV